MSELPGVPSVPVPQREESTISLPKPPQNEQSTTSLSIPPQNEQSTTSLAVPPPEEPSTISLSVPPQEQPIPLAQNVGPPDIIPASSVEELGEVVQGPQDTQVDIEELEKRELENFDLQGEEHERRRSVTAAAKELAVLGEEGIKALKSNMAKKKLIAIFVVFEAVAILMAVSHMIFFSKFKGTPPTVFASISSSNFFLALVFFIGVDLHGFVILAFNIGSLANGILFMFLVMIVTNLALTSASRGMYSLELDISAMKVIEYMKVEQQIVLADHSLEQRAKGLFVFLTSVYNGNKRICSKFKLAEEFTKVTDWEMALNFYLPCQPTTTVKCCQTILLQRIKALMIFNIICCVTIIIMVFVLAAIFWHYYAEMKAMEFVDIGQPPDFDLLGLELPTFVEVDEEQAQRARAKAKSHKDEKKKHKAGKGVQDRLRRQSSDHGKGKAQRAPTRKGRRRH